MGPGGMSKRPETPSKTKRSSTNLDKERGKGKALFIKVKLPTARSKQRYYDMGKWTYNVKRIDT
jgi:hypothetical protein